MRYLPKILKLFLFSILIIIILAISATFLFRDTITGILINSINSSISTTIKAEKVKLSFLRSFPKGSVELRNVVIGSSPDLIKSDFEGQFADTLLFAKSIFLRFRISEIVKGNYKVETISVKDGKANLLSDRSGNTNYKIRSGNPTTGSDNINVDLDKILLSEIVTSYIDLKNKFILSGDIDNAKLKSRIFGEKVELTAKADLEIINLTISKTKFNHLGFASVDLNMLSSENGITFDESKIDFGVVQLGINGSIDHDNVPDLKITTSRIGLSNLENFLPVGYSLEKKGFKADGLLELTCFVTGPLQVSGMPHLEIDFNVANGKAYKENTSIFKSVNLFGQFSNGIKNSASTSSLKLRDLEITMAQSGIRGSLIISDFIGMPTEATLSGKVFPNEILELFNQKDVSDVSGFADVDLKLKTLLKTGDTSLTERMLRIEPVGKVSLNSFSFYNNKKDFGINDCNGNIWFSDIIQAENLRFNFKDQNIKIDGKFNNLPAWLAGKPVMLLADVDIDFDSFLPGNVISDDNNSPNGKKEISFPENIQLNLNFSAGKVIYKTFSSSDVKSSLNYKSKLLTFNSLSMKSLEGDISGEGFIVKNANRSIISRGDFTLKKIDVNKAFTTFGNFGQKFIVAENLSGKLSGTVSVLLPMDSLFRINTKTITADGTFNLEEGALINFEPVKQLSDFIELSELENIHFQNLENDFYIRNNVLFIPSMDVKSSAADLTVNGKHSFDNQYEYHVKVLLSQILSKKRKTVRKPVTEFGTVQDDGLGRTSLLLKIENKGDDVKVGYDMKAVGSGVKESIKNEKQTIKTILNEEYGWYNNQAKQVTKTPEPKKKKFNISWSETDSIQ
ncbi:MAG TPA: AsmA-like C-terminal region-containing protein [Bacteroidales bacterium]|nr:AsmA-like C-terminal region-containing protein [Bacteroidales bacterium]